MSHDAAARREAEAEPVASEEGVVGPREVGHAPPGGALAGRAADAGRLTADGRFISGRLAGLGMAGAIWALSWPVTAESFLNSLVGLTDTAFAAQIGVAETDAIGAASYIMWFIGLVVMAVALGATSLVSRAVGAGRMAAANAVLGQSLVLGLVLGLGVAGLVAGAAPLVAGWLRLSEDAGAAFTAYMRVIALGVPAESVLFVLVACARGAGDSVRPMYAMALRNAVNIVASWALSGVDVSLGAGADGEPRVWQNPLGFDLGIAGVAWGTVVADLVATSIVLAMALRGVWGIRVKARRLRPHWVTQRRLVRLGVPNFLETAGMWVGNFLVITLVGMIALAEGRDGLQGAHILAIRIEAISFLPGFAMGTAAAALAGQYLGARRPDLARRAVWICTMIGAGVMTLLGVAFIAVPGAIVGALSAQPVHHELTPTLLIIAGLVQGPFGVGIVLRSAMRGAGDVHWVMWLTWVSTYAVRLPLAYLLSGADIVIGAGDGAWRVLNPMPDDFVARGLVGLWIGLCTDIVIRGGLFLGRFLHGGWLKHRV